MINKKTITDHPMDILELTFDEERFALIQKQGGEFNRKQKVIMLSVREAVEIARTIMTAELAQGAIAQY